MLAGEGVIGKVERWLGGRLKDIRGFIEGLYEHDRHAKRVDALAGATLGVMTSASLAVAVIGQALAQARGLVTKHAIKQVDRLLSNQNIDVWDSFARWVPHLIGTRKEIVVAVDWTEFDRDGQATLALNLVTGHGRATPLLWVTVWKEELTDQRNDFEDACLLASTAMQVNYYAKRWTIEPNFRDTKDLRFGMGLGATRIGEPTRRDRLLLINAFAMVLLTMLGAAGESLGMDRLLKSNTSKIRTHSLFRQGCMLYELIPTMPDQRLFPLMARFAKTVSKCRSFSGLFEVI